MTRKKLLKKITDLQLEWDAEHTKWATGRPVYKDVIYTKVDKWLKEAPDAWFPLALDLINVPPDDSYKSSLKPFAYSSKDDPIEEFLIAMEYLLAIWYRYHPDLWLREMTPMLNNQVVRSSEARYSSACDMALIIANRAASFAPIELLAPMIGWVAPLSDKRKELTKQEAGMYDSTLLSLFNWYALPQCPFYLSFSGHKKPLLSVGLRPHLPRPDEDAG